MIAKRPASQNESGFFAFVGLCDQDDGFKDDRVKQKFQFERHLFGRICLYTS